MKPEFWDQRADEYDKEIQVHDDLYDKTVQATLGLLGPADVVLEYGCASGEQSLDLAPHVAHITGIDISARMIEIAQQKAETKSIPNAAFNQGDVINMDLTTGSFSAVIAFNILHLVDTQRALTRLHDVLHDNGLLISQTPCISNRGFFFRGMLSLLQKSGVAPPIHNFTVPGLEAVIRNSGFEIVESTLWEKASAVQWIVARKR